jgi:hypothetical protein
VSDGTKNNWEHLLSEFFVAHIRETAENERDVFDVVAFDFLRRWEDFGRFYLFEEVCWHGDCVGVRME